MDKFQENQKDFQQLKFHFKRPQNQITPPSSIRTNSQNTQRSNTTNSALNINHRHNSQPTPQPQPYLTSAQRIQVDMSFLIDPQSPGDSVLLFCRSNSPEIPMDFRLAKTVMALFREFLTRPLKKTKSGDFWWTIAFKDYDRVLRRLVRFGLNVTKIPTSTIQNINALSTFENHLLRFGELPERLRRKLLPFQREGVAFSLRRGGRVFIADEMGTGKSLQALAVALCFQEEWPLLIVAPAALRLIWAAEIEKWLPDVLPCDVQLLTSSNQMHDFNKKIVITSYAMLSILQKDILRQRYKVAIIDECHKIKASHRAEKLSGITLACIKLLSSCKRAILLSGTPCISKPFNLYYQVNSVRPGILGDVKAFARNYCGMKLVSRRGKLVADLSGGTRLNELRALLYKTLMIRRLKADVQNELPRLVRQVFTIDIGTKLKNSAKEVAKIRKKLEGGETRSSQAEAEGNPELENAISEMQTIGALKIKAVCEFLRQVLSGTSSTCKIVVFAHHKIVIKALAQFSEENRVGYVVIQGQVLPEERVEAVQKFRREVCCRLAIVSITAGNVGFDLSCSTRLVFAELPATQADLRQAESRVHRRNQLQSVTAYYAVARGTADDRRWRNLSRQLRNTTGLLNVTREELSVDRVFKAKNSPSSVKDYFKVVSTKKAKSIEKEESPPQLNFVTEMRRKANLRLSRISRIDLKRKLRRPEEAKTPKTRFNTLLGPVITTEEKQLGSMKKLSTSDLRLANKAIWEKRFSRANSQKTPTFSLHLMLSNFSERLYLFEGPLRSDYNKKSVNISDVNQFSEKDFFSLKLTKTISPLFDRRRFRAIRRFCQNWSISSKVTQNKIRGRIVPVNYEFTKKRGKKTLKKKVLLKKTAKTPRISEKNQVCPSTQTSRTTFKSVVYTTKTRGGKLYVNFMDQKFDSEDNPLCKECEGKYSPLLAAEKNLRAFFCSNSCLREHKIKTEAQQGRRQIFEVEKGVCQKCGEDLRALYLRLKNLSPKQRQGILGQIESFSNLSGQRLKSICAKSNFTEGLLWQADHIVPVQFGGGSCSLDNFQTLCVGCHALKTKEQSQFAAAMRKATHNADNGTEEKEYVIGRVD